MPPPLLSAYFQAQRPCCHTLEVPLAAAITAIGNGAGVAVAVPKFLSNNIHEKVQSLDIAAPKTPVSSRALGNTGQSVYYCASSTANTAVILLVGKPHETNKNQVVPFFDWIISAEDQTALNGDWDPGDLDNTIDMAFTGALKFDHKNKHFTPGNNSEAQYTIGTEQRRKNIVAGMEQKALDHGFGSGERFFRFSAVVGNDPKSATRAIRVDTPLGPSQHSHPIPETGVAEVNHDSKVVYFIYYHTRERQLDELVKLAKYLRLIAAPKKSFTNLKKGKHLCGGLMPPACAYWSW